MALPSSLGTTVPHNEPASSGFQSSNLDRVDLRFGGILNPPGINANENGQPMRPIFADFATGQSRIFPSIDGSLPSITRNTDASWPPLQIPEQIQRSEKNTNDDAVELVMGHHLFPQIFKAVNEILYGSELAQSERMNLEALHQNESVFYNLDSRERLGRIEGVGPILSAILDALKSIQLKTAKNIPAQLQETIRACKKPPAHSDSYFNFLPEPFVPLSMNQGGTNPRLDEQAKENLNTWFDEHFHNPFPTYAEKLQLAKENNLEMNQILNFFGNRRMRYKRKALALVHSGKAVWKQSKSLSADAKWLSIVDILIQVRSPLHPSFKHKSNRISPPIPSISKAGTRRRTANFLADSFLRTDFRQE